MGIYDLFSSRMTEKKNIYIYIYILVCSSWNSVNAPLCFLDILAEYSHAWHA